MKKRLKTLLPDNVKTDVAFQDKQLNSCFNIKDKTKFPHKHDLVYHARCAEESYNDDFVSEKAKHIFERVLDHSGRDKKFSYFKTRNQKRTPLSTISDFQSYYFSYYNNTMKRKLSEALWINTLRPSLNKQEKSVPLKLFN